MFKMFSSLFRSADTESPVIVDYTASPLLPKGAARLHRHVPAGAGVFTLEPGDLDLVRFRRGTTYLEFGRDHAHEPLADAIIIDAISAQIRENFSNPHKVDALIERMFGNFSGQIFFLGTSFESEDGRECVPFLNIRTYMSAFRYICPAAHVINHDLDVCACFLRRRRIAAAA